MLLHKRFVKGVEVRKPRAPTWNRIRYLTLTKTPRRSLNGDCVFLELVSILSFFKNTFIDKKRLQEIPDNVKSVFYCYSIYGVLVLFDLKSTKLSLQNEIYRRRSPQLFVKKVHLTFRDCNLPASSTLTQPLASSHRP